MVLLNAFKILFLIVVISVQNNILCTFSINNRHEIETIEPEKIEIVHGTLGVKERNPERNILPIPPQGIGAAGSTPNGAGSGTPGGAGGIPNPYLMFHYPEPSWRASAILVPDSSDGNDTAKDLKGQILFHQWNPNNFVRITVNATGIPPGKHAVHIHFYGDVSQGCKSTGSHFESHFIGNIEAKDDGEISVSFFSAFLTMFGYPGIIGRSVVIHEKPIESNSFPPDVFSAPIMATNTASFQTEENSVGPAIACGVITLTENPVQ